MLGEQGVADTSQQHHGHEEWHGRLGSHDVAFPFGRGFCKFVNLCTGEETTLSQPRVCRRAPCVAQRHENVSAEQLRSRASFSAYFPKLRPAQPLLTRTGPVLLPF